MTAYSLIRSALRRAWLRFPERTEALIRARRPYKGDNKRQKWEFSCAICKGWFKSVQVQVDHIKPCGSFTEESHWSTFGPNLFCSVNGLRVLCIECHKKVTKEQRAKRGPQ